METYSIKYEVSGKEYSQRIEARDVKSAKTKLGKKHGYSTGRNIKVKEVKVIGYF